MHRAAVLVLEHDPVRGTVGLLLNTPSNATVGRLLSRKPDRQLTSLADKQLLIGGNVLSRDRLRVLTERCDVPNSREVLPGLYQCSAHAAAKMVTVGAASTHDFDVYAAACQWSAELLAEELENAVWLPAAASVSALRPPSPLPHSLYFSLIEGIGGEYARQALLARSGAEVDQWLQDRTHAAVHEWRDLARIADDAARAEVAADEAVLRIHSVLYPRDNLTDVRLRIAEMAEQAAYIWFTTELENSAVGATDMPAEPPLKDPSLLLPSPRKKKPRAVTRAWSASSRGAKGGDGALSQPLLKVFSADQAGAISKQNALLAINLLLFELLQFKALERGSVTQEQTSLPPLVRRNGGAASLFSLCLLYASISRNLGVPLQLVTLAPPPMISAHGPQFLLRLPQGDAHDELYIDVASDGRLRQTHDLRNYFIHGEVANAQPAQLREFLLLLPGGGLCVEMLRELEAACTCSNLVAHATFWKVQRSVLKEQLAVVRSESDGESVFGA